MDHLKYQHRRLQMKIHQLLSQKFHWVVLNEEGLDERRPFGHVEGGYCLLGMMVMAND